MLERMYTRPATHDRIRRSWISPSIETYLKWLEERGYSIKSAGHRVPVLVRFGEFALSRGAKRVKDLPRYVGSFVSHWIDERGKRRRTPGAKKKCGLEARNPVEQMLRLVVPGFMGSGRPQRPLPFADSAPGFFSYLREERGLREASIHQYVHQLRGLESYLARLRLRRLSALSPAVLSGYMVEEGRRRSKNCMPQFCSCARVFLRYLHRERLTKKDLSLVVEQPSAYRNSALPRSVTWDEVRRLLEVIDRRSATGRRDYAIMLLLVTYGLRAREVAALTLDDVDWRAERLQVPQRKAGHSSTYPLSPLVAEAILDYLKDGRPKTADRRVFFRVLAPQVPITHGMVSSRAGHYLRKIGSTVPRAGSHTLRHTCVQRLVDGSFSLKEIGDYVGHRRPSSTQIYGKVQLERLRDVALGDGEALL